VWDVLENLTRNLSLDEATQITSPSTALLSSLPFIVNKVMYSRNYSKEEEEPTNLLRRRRFLYLPSSPRLLICDL
jgi:hypothetical protein